MEGRSHPARPAGRPAYLRMMAQWDEQLACRSIVDPALLFQRQDWQPPTDDVLQLLRQEGGRHTTDSHAQIPSCGSPLADLHPPSPLRSIRRASSSHSLLDEVIALRELVAAVLAASSLSAESAGKAAVDRRRSAGSRPTPAELWRYLRKLGNARLNGAIGGPVQKIETARSLRCGLRTQNDACRGGAGADDDHMAPTPAQLALTALFQLDRTGQLSPAELRRHFEGGWSKVLAKEVFASGNSPTCLGQVDVAKADAHTPSWSVDEDQVAEKAARGSVSQQGPDEAAAVVSNHETSQHGEPETNDHTDTVSPPQPRNATDATVLARAAAAASPSCVGGALRPGLLRLPAEVVAHLCAKVGGRTRRTLRLVCVQLAHQCRAVSAHRLWSTVYMDSQKANVMSRWRAEDRKSVAEDSNQNIANAAPMEQDENPGLAELLAQNSLDDIDEPDITRPDAFCQSEIDAIHNFLRIQRLANRGDAVGRILLDRNYPLAARKALQTRYTLRRVRREVKRNANDCRATSPTDFEFGADTVHGEVVAVRHQGKARFDPDIESRVAAGQIGMPSARITRWLQLVPPSLWYDAIAAAVAQWIRVEGLSQVQMDVSQDATPMETAVSGVLAALARPPLEMTNVPPAAIFFYFALHPLQDKLFLNNFFLLWTKRLQDRRHMVDVLVLRRSLLKRRFMRWSDRIKSRLKLEIEKKVPVPSGKSKPLNSSAVNMPNNVDILLRRSLYCVEPEVVEIRKALNVAHEKQQNMRNRLRTARLVLANTLREELPSMDQTVALTAQKLATMLDRNADEGSKHV